MEPMTNDEIEAAKASCPDWAVIDGERLRREFTFASFVEAFGVMAQIAIWAEKLDHHPEWSNVYNQVTVELTTHDAGDGGLTERDFSLAGHIDDVVAPLISD